MKPQYSIQTRAYCAVPFKQPLLRPPTRRELWVETLKRMGKKTDHLSLSGGYVHQYLFETFQSDAQALDLKFLLHNIFHLENHVLLPEVRKRLASLNLSTKGDYPECRQRLDAATGLFSKYESQHATTEAE